MSLQYGKEIFKKEKHFILISDIFGFKKDINNSAIQDDCFIENFSELNQENFEDFIADKYGEDELKKIPNLIILESEAVYKEVYAYESWPFIKTKFEPILDRWESKNENKEIITGLTIGYLRHDNLFYSDKNNDVFTERDIKHDQLFFDRAERRIKENDFDDFIKAHIAPFKNEGYKKLLNYLIEFSNQTRIGQDIMNATYESIQKELNDEVNMIKLSLNSKK
jgi:hypothetical protein